MILFEKLKVNGITNPIGFQIHPLTFSFIVVEGELNIPENLKLEVSSLEDFTTLLYSTDFSLDESIGIEVHDLKLNEKTRYFWRITDQGNRDVLSETAFFETGLLNGFSADFILTKDSTIPPIFYHEFSLKKEVEQARLYVTGVGLYEASINEKKVGDEYLTPHCNDYDKFIQYQTYEVNNLIMGANYLEVNVGSGWYKGKFGINQKENIFGEHFGCIAELHVKYKDGETALILTNKNWKAKASFVIESSIYDGEIIDYQRDESQLLETVVDNKFKHRLVERISLPIKEKLTLKPELIVTETGQHILDFHQNMVGLVSFDGLLEENQTLTLTFGEILQNGSFYRDNLRTAKAQFVIKGDGVKRQHRSHFTFYGFRYVLVEGINTIDPDCFTGMVLYSDLEETGFIKTSDPLINKLFENAKWGQRGNFLDVPMDCPQRDERLGWTADAQVFAPTASYNMNTMAFYRKYMNDLKNDQQRYNGGIPNYSPSFKESMVAGSVWGDAATIIPMVLYRFYGNQSLLQEHYTIMRDYIEYLIAKDREDGNSHLYNTGFHFGDWLAQDGMSAQSLKGGTDDYYIASMYYYHSVTLVSEAASILGLVDDELEYKELAQKIKSAILQEYFSPSGRLTIDTQTGYIVSLYMGIYVKKEKIIEGLKSRLIKDYYRVKSGFVGTPLICSVLLENGLVEEAYRMLFEQDHPSWLYQVNLGATTIWERWNSVLPNGEISGTNMNSLNHYAYGSIISFLYENVAGLKATKPGFKAVTIKPTPHYELKEITTDYHSASGRYHIQWEINQENRFHLDVIRPIGTEVIIHLPDFDSEFELIDGEFDWIDAETLSLKSLSFSCSYKMSVDHLHPFSVNSVIIDLMKNKQAEAIIKEKIPQVYKFLTGENDEFISFRLHEIAYLPMTFIEEELLNEIDVLLQEVRV